MSINKTFTCFLILVALVAYSAGYAASTMDAIVGRVERRTAELEKALAAYQKESIQIRAKALRSQTQAQQQTAKMLEQEAKIDLLKQEIAKLRRVAE